MAIKSIEELRALRKTLNNQVTLRERGESTEDIIEILVGMGTCGISAGARDTFNKLISEINLKNLKNVKVVSVGCIGSCSLEPTVQISIPGKEPIVYGKITEDVVEKLIQKVIIENDYLDDNYVVKAFEKAQV